MTREKKSPAAWAGRDAAPRHGGTITPGQSSTLEAEVGSLKQKLEKYQALSGSRTNHLVATCIEHLTMHCLRETARLQKELNAVDSECKAYIRDLSILVDELLAGEKADKANLTAAFTRVENSECHSPSLAYQKAVGSNGNEPPVRVGLVNSDTPALDNMQSGSAIEQSGDDRALPSRQIENSKKPGPAGQLRVKMFGEFAVHCDESSRVCLTGGKASQIFKYLITHRPGLVPREVLMEMFWPRHDPDSARNNLNVAIYSLRKDLAKHGLGRSWVLFHDGGYELNPEKEVIADIDRFREAVASAMQYQSRRMPDAAYADYMKAKQYYQGDFLNEDLYEEWAVEIREELKSKYTAALRFLMNYAVEKDDFKTARDCCNKLLLIDPCDEEVNANLMRVYAASGQRHLAVRQYQLCKEALKKDLDMSPCRELTELFNRIRDGFSS